METLLLLLLAVLPPAAFMVFIHWMDRHEPESLGAILGAMVCGALSVVPAALIQLALGDLPLFLPGRPGAAAFESFLLVAPSEELLKFLAIFIYLRRKTFYDEVNDGIVYYGAGAIGFAMLENIFYVLGYGFTTGVLRAFTSIPIHTFCGVIIGYHAGLARFAGQKRPGLLVARGLFLAYLTHALFNTLVSAGNLVSLLFIPLVAAVYFAGYRILKRGRRLSLIASGGVGIPETASASLPVAAPAGGPPPPPPPPPRRRALLPPPGPITGYRPGDVLADSGGRLYLPPKREGWKAFVGRTLLATCALFWVLALFGAEGTPGEWVEILMGLVILTFVPVLTGVLLESSYRRRRRARLYLG